MTVSPLTLYESKTESPPVIMWDCSFAFDGNEYKLTRGCSCGTVLSVLFGYKGEDINRVAGYIVCPDCRKNWYYEIPMTFVFREV